VSFGWTSAIGQKAIPGALINPSSPQPPWVRGDKDKTVIPRKRPGPVPTGEGQQIVVRLQPAPLADLDSLIEKQKEPLTRPEAMRRLVELGLKAKK
jgi:hypothetical protein